MMTNRKLQKVLKNKQRIKEKNWFYLFLILCIGVCRPNFPQRSNSQWGVQMMHMVVHMMMKKLTQENVWERDDVF